MHDFDIEGAIKVVESESRTELEDALVKAVYWYSDAHRDTVPVMQLVKYWSCVETFFSADPEHIVQAVTKGLATVLADGGYRFVPVHEYRQLKKKITRLYGLRSQAVHRASHNHVTRGDTALLSQWTAWMILTLFRMREHGYTELSQLKAQSERLDALHPAGRAWFCHIAAAHG